MIKAVAVLGAFAALAACSSGSGTDGPTITKTVTVTANTPTLPPSTPSTAKTPVLKVGQTFVNGSASTATVVAYEDQGQENTGSSETTTRPRDLEVKVCALDDGGGVSGAPWYLVGSDSSLNHTTLSGGGLHEPQFPINGVPLNKGQCVTGWIIFDVATSVHVTQARYIPSDEHNKQLYGGTWSIG